MGVGAGLCMYDVCMYVCMNVCIFRASVQPTLDPYAEAFL